MTRRLLEGGMGLAARVRSERQLRQALVALTHYPDGDQPTAPDAATVSSAPLADLVERAHAHKLLFSLRSSLADVDIPPALRERLDGSYFAAVRHQMVAALDLWTLAEALDKVSVPWLLVKGPVVAELLYTTPELRTFVDLDVVVPADRFAEAVAVLERAGAAILDTDWTVLVEEMRGQLHLVMPRGTMVDLHWNLLNRATVRGSFSVSATEALLTGSRQVTVAGRQVMTLDAATSLVHLCVHAALSGGHRLIWLKDIDRAVVVDRPDWASVVRTARSWRARLAVGAMLARSQAVLGTPVPPAVLNELVPWPWRPALRVLDRAAPVVGQRGGLSLLSVSTPALRDRGVRASPRILRAVWNLRRSAVGWSAGRASLDSPAPADREQYLTAVGRAAGEGGA